MSAKNFLSLFEGPADYARFDHLSPEYKRDILAKVTNFLKTLGRQPDNADLQKLSRLLTLAIQDVATLVRQIMTRPQDNPAARAMVPESK